MRREGSLVVGVSVLLGPRARLAVRRMRAELAVRVLLDAVGRVVRVEVLLAHCAGC